MTEVRRLFFAGTIALSTLAHPRAANAGPSDAELRSRQLFKQADGLANDGRWAEACPLFQAAHDLHGTGGTALRSADCYEKVGKFDRALTQYTYILDHRDTEKEPARVTLAEVRVAALKKQLGLDQPAPRAQKAPPPPPLPPPPPPPPPPSKVPAWIAFGVGGFGLVAGGVLGGVALAEAGDVKTLCHSDPKCAGSTSSQDAKSKWGVTMGTAWGANVGFVVAIAGAVTGVVLLVRASSPAKTKKVVEQALGPGGVTFRF